LRILIKRNILIFSRDKGAIFLACFSIILVIALYALFLFNVFKNSLISTIASPDNLITTFTVSGLLAITNVTCANASFQIFVEDKISGTIKDFLIIFDEKQKIFLSYIISAYIIGNLVSLITLFIGQIYIISMGGAWLSIMDTLSLFFLIQIALISSMSILFFLSLFFKSNKAYSTANTIIGTTIGFLSGVFIPVGSLPKNLQWIVKIMPASHQSALFKTILMKQPLADAFSNNQGAINDFSLTMGVFFEFKCVIINNVFSILYLVLLSIIFFILAYYVFINKIKNV